MKVITMHPVDATQLVSAGYDGDTETLYIEFKGGIVYKYLEVPLNVFNNLKNSSSPGRFFVSSIRQFYDYSRTNLIVRNGLMTLQYEPNKIR